jgi:enamine deaminase RidA (YjgF/YER057c/UK114 family)
MPGDADPPDDAYAQARICFEIIAAALAEAGASLADVVRSRMFLTSASDIDAVARAHLEALGAARPASTAVVTALLDPRWRIEVEVEAVIGEPG